MTKQDDDDIIHMTFAISKAPVRIFVNGKSLETIERLRSLRRKPLAQSDIPNEDWSARLFDGLFLREDGAIVRGDAPETEYGFRREDGTVSWVRG